MSNFFGDKKVFKSITAWGIMCLALGQAFASAGADTGMLSESGSAVAEQILTFLGIVLTGFGARRAQGKAITAAGGE